MVEICQSQFSEAKTEAEIEKRKQNRNCITPDEPVFAALAQERRVWNSFKKETNYEDRHHEVMAFGWVRRPNKSVDPPEIVQRLFTNNDFLAGSIEISSRLQHLALKSGNRLMRGRQHLSGG